MNEKPPSGTIFLIVLFLINTLILSSIVKGGQQSTVNCLAKTPGDYYAASRPAAGEGLLMD